MTVASAGSIELMKVSVHRANSKPAAPPQREHARLGEQLPDEMPPRWRRSTI